MPLHAGVQDQTVSGYSIPTPKKPPPDPPLGSRPQRRAVVAGDDAEGEGEEEKCGCHDYFSSPAAQYGEQKQRVGAGAWGYVLVPERLGYR